MSEVKDQYAQFLILIKTQWRTAANLFTAFRAVLSLLVLYLLICHSTWAAFVYIVAASTDWVDGMLARGLHQVTFLGKIVDPIVDKLLIICAGIGVCIVQPKLGIIAPIVIILAREIGVMALVQIYRRNGMILSVTWEGKVKTALQGVFFATVMLRLGGAWTNFLHTFMIVTVTATVISGIDYVVRAHALSRPISEALSELD